MKKTKKTITKIKTKTKQQKRRQRCSIVEADDSVETPPKTINMISVFSFNCLEPNTNSSPHGPDSNQTNSRLQNCLAISIASKADFICLQEANQAWCDTIVIPTLQSIGYTSTYNPKRNLLTAWKSNKFKIRWENFRSRALIVCCDSIIAIPKSTTTTTTTTTTTNTVILPPPVTIVNVHLEGDPSRGRDRVIQLSNVFKYVRGAEKSAGKCSPFIIAGDFNSMPNGEVMQMGTRMNVPAGFLKEKDLKQIKGNINHHGNQSVDVQSLMYDFTSLRSAYCDGTKEVLKSYRNSGTRSKRKKKGGTKKKNTRKDLSPSSEEEDDDDEHFYNTLVPFPTYVSARLRSNYLQTRIDHILYDERTTKLVAIRKTVTPHLRANIKKHGIVHPMTHCSDHFPIAAIFEVMANIEEPEEIKNDDPTSEERWTLEMLLWKTPPFMMGKKKQKVVPPHHIRERLRSFKKDLRVFESNLSSIKKKKWMKNRVKNWLKKGIKFTGERCVHHQLPLPPLFLRRQLSKEGAKLLFRAVSSGSSDEDDSSSVQCKTMMTTTTTTVTATSSARPMLRRYASDEVSTTQQQIYPRQTSDPTNNQST
jgi:endonuclease/exonuclease/phosphatase family metal-dependent hydrolase